MLLPLQVSMQCAEQMGCKDSIIKFVLPLGSTVNMNGTALYEATTVIFIAQVCTNIIIYMLLVTFWTLLGAYSGNVLLPAILPKAILCLDVLNVDSGRSTHNCPPRCVCIDRASVCIHVHDLSAVFCHL